MVGGQWSVVSSQWSVVSGHHQAQASEHRSGFSGTSGSLHVSFQLVPYPKQITNAWFLIWHMYMQMTIGDWIVKNGWRQSHRHAFLAPFVSTAVSYDDHTYYHDEPISLDRGREERGMRVKTGSCLQSSSIGSPEASLLSNLQS